MSEAVLVTLIGSGLSLIGVVFTNSQSNKKIESTLDKKQAVTDEKITELTREVENTTILLNVCQLLNCK